MHRLFVVALPVSVVAHVGVIAAVLALVADRHPEPALFVDLTDPVAVAEIARRVETRDGSRPAAPSARSSRGRDDAGREARAGTIGPSPARLAQSLTAGAEPADAAGRDPGQSSRAPAIADHRASAATMRESAAVDWPPSPLHSPAIDRRTITPAAADTAPAGQVSVGTGPDARPLAGDARAGARGSRGTAGAGGGDDPARGAGSGAARGSGAGAGDGTRAASTAIASAGSHESPEGEYGPYLATVRLRLQETLRYPPAAVRRQLSGTVDVEIVVSAAGDVGEVRVVRSSSHAVLDDAAVDAVRRLPRVPFPAGLAPRAIRARLPVVFELR